MTNIQETLPFQGEMMTCFLCNKKQQSEPGINNNWRSVTIENYRYYVCPGHLPDIDNATREEYMQAYKRILRSILDDVARLREWETKHSNHRDKSRRVN